jgi:hypothetical protein
MVKFLKKRLILAGCGIPYPVATGWASGYQQLKALLGVYKHPTTSQNLASVDGLWTLHLASLAFGMHIQYVGRSLKVNGSFGRDTYSTGHGGIKSMRVNKWHVLQ